MEHLIVLEFSVAVPLKTTCSNFSCLVVVQVAYILCVVNCNIGCNASSHMSHKSFSYRVCCLFAAICI